MEAFTEGGTQAVMTRTRVPCAIDSRTQAQHSRAAHRHGQTGSGGLSRRAGSTMMAEPVDGRRP